LESDDSVGQPLMAYGFYPTLSDIVRIATLYQDHGAFRGKQILYGPKIDELLAHETPPGLPTHTASRFGERYYFNAYWETAFQSGQKCKLYYPQMEGWGGTVIALFPNASIGIRVSKIWEDKDATAAETSGMATTVDRLRVFCPRGRKFLRAASDTQKR
jgi:hypothetical protein